MININKIAIAIIGILVVVGAVILLSTNANKGDTDQSTTAPATQTEATTPAETSANQDETLTDTMIDITATGYDPKTIIIKAGAKVVWTNNSGQVGNVSSVPHPTHSTYPPLNLGDFSDGATVSLVFDEPGAYEYHNHLNATQTGTVIVTQ